METQSLAALDQLESAEGHCELASAEMRAREGKCEEECVGIESAVALLQHEVAEKREQRQTNMKMARQQLRSQVARREDASRRRFAAHEAEYSIWAQRINQSEDRVFKLEQEV